MESYVIRNVKYITNENVDIIIKNGIIHGITNAGTGEGDKIYDCSGMFISSGWIDLHVHAFSKLDPYGDLIDEVGIKQGVTTVVDAGSCGADQFAELMMKQEQSKTNLFAFLNISTVGLSRMDELSDLDLIDQQKIFQTINKYPNHIIGLKARMSKSVIGRKGLQPLRMARKIADKTSLPLMIHIGSSPPLIEEIILYLKRRDIITHYLNNKSNGIFDENNLPKQQVIKAIQDGILLDVGHGSASFSFSVAEMAKKHGIHFDTISTDIYRRNRLYGPVYNMETTLTKFLYLGYPLCKIIHAVTKTPAQFLNKPELGRIKIGDQANLTLFTVENKSIKLTDSEGNTRHAQQKITAKGVVSNGEFITYET